MSIFKKGKIIGSVFMKGAICQLDQEGTWLLGVGVGLYQGLKYTGSFKRGMISGTIVVSTLAGINGINTVIRNRDLIKTYFKEAN